MLTESFVAATLSANPPSQHLGATLKDVGIFLHELQPQTILRQGFKKSSVQPECLAVSRSHIFAAQSSKAVVNVYSREKGNQESTVPFPEKIRSIAYANGPEVLVLGTEDGKLLLWEVATGRMSTSTAAHLQAITLLQLTPNDEFILSGSQDSTVQIWSLSCLLSFVIDADAYASAGARNAPIASWSQHRAPIVALGCGRSRSRTNFAISASEDSVCHIWHIQTCQMLRTILLPSVPTCLVMDPADRAAFLGDSSGGIVSVDISALGRSIGAPDSRADLPTSLSEHQQWQSSSDVGAMHCLDISYDGTSLVSGHASGVIQHWDVAKYKVAAEVLRLGQPITSVTILRPEGLSDSAFRGFQMAEIMKPKLEFSAQIENGTSSVPASYKMQVNLSGLQRNTSVVARDDTKTAMTSNGWPDGIVDNAVEALARSEGDISRQSVSDIRRAETLEKDVAELKRSLATYKNAELQRMDRSIQRMAKRGDIDLRRRQAYHDAIKQGKDKRIADAEMQGVMDRSKGDLERLDAESDAEAFPDEMDTR